jgi:deazaflavin-dependent oxidoreductase (nitroreductase family)
MAKTYRLTPGRRALNRIVRAFNSMGIGSESDVLMTVKGRKTGISRTTPVTLVRDAGSRWIVAPYGEVSWVQNARAAGEVKLTRGRRSETVRVRELASAESAPVLKAYIARVAVTRPFFDVNPGSPIDAFVAEAPRHPVFLIEPLEEPA